MFIQNILRINLQFSVSFKESTKIFAGNYFMLSISSEKPDPPTNIRLLANSHSITANWDAPLFKGNIDDIEYVVYYYGNPIDINSKGITQLKTDRLTAIIRPLPSATNYNIRVTAVNRLGESDFSAMENINTKGKGI